MNNVFLDLEQTVLSSWDEGVLVNKTKVHDFLKEQKATGFHVFSFAVWNDDDVNEFNRRFKTFLENALDCKVLSCFSCADFRKADTELTGVRFDDLTDFISVRGKVGAFQSWCELNFSGQSNVLVDDVVPNAVWNNFTTKTKCVFVNVDDLN
jgi:hypothetical protein